MSVMRRIAPCLLVAIATGAIAAPAQEKTKPANATPAAELRRQDSEVIKRKERAMARVRSCAERTKGFADGRNTAAALIRIASVVCPYDTQYARDLFTGAYNTLITAELMPQKAEEPKVMLPPGVRGPVKVPERPAPEISAELNFLFSRATLCDEGFASELRQADALKRKNERSRRDYEPSLSAAFQVAETEPEKAAVLAEQAARRGLAGIAMQHFGILLRKLEKTDRAGANRAFLAALETLAAQPSVDMQDLTAAGLYLFTGPGMGDDGVMFSSVGKRVGLINIGVDRPGIEPDMVRAYLSTALEILLRPNLTSQQKAAYYAVATILTPRFQQHLPQRLPELETGMKLLSAEVPAELMDPAAYAQLTDTNAMYGPEREAKIAKVPDDDARDERYLAYISWILHQMPVEHVRRIVGLVHSPELKKRLETQADFAEANMLIGKGQIEAAQAIAGRMPPGLERAIARLAIAKALASKDKRGAAIYVNMALEGTARIDEEQRPGFVAAAARVMADADAKAAIEVFQQAVELMNRYEAQRLLEVSEAARQTAADAKVTPRRPLPSGRVPFSVTVEFNAFERRFPIGQPWLGPNQIWAGDFEQIVKRLAELDAAAVETQVMAIQSEQVLAQALPALAGAALSAIKP